MGKTKEQLKVVLEPKPWAKIGQVALSLLLIGCGIYYISLYDLIERLWIAGEFNTSLLDGASLYVLIYILFWFGIGLYFLVPRRVRFDDNGIIKKGLLGKRRLPYSQVGHLRLTHNSMYIQKNKLFNFVSANRVMHKNFDSVVGLLSQKVNEVKIDVKGGEEVVEAFLESKEGRKYLQQPARIFGSTTRKGLGYFAGFSVVAIGIITLFIVYADQIKPMMNKWVLMGIYFLLIAVLMWIGGNILLTYSNRKN